MRFHIIAAPATVTIKCLNYYYRESPSLPSPTNPAQAVIFGGVPRPQQVTLLADEKPNIVVGTPGRVMDLIESGNLKVDKCKHFILDECDKMLETLDMRKQVQTVFLKTPHEKQVRACERAVEVNFFSCAAELCLCILEYFTR